MVEENQIPTSSFLGMTAVIASQPMRRLMERVERVAKCSASVLITGESGSGKELVARAVHQFSPRAHRSWVDLSCAALPEHLLESELFGYDRGAFSGADTSKPGLFELAHQGTLFLDEIGELDPKMQVKLLRVLDGVPYYRLGATKKVSADVRVVAATNQNLELLVDQGRFRGDLFHRLSQLTLHVPPLRERVEDIAPLATYLLRQQNPGAEFTHRALRILESHAWPGNVRELRNVIMKAAVMHSDRDTDVQIDAEHLPMSASVAASPWSTSSWSTSSPAAPAPANASSLEGMERRMILDALAATGGHQQRAAARLGISRRTLSRKLKTYESERAQAVL